MRIGILQTGVTPDDLIEKHGSYAHMFVRLFDQKGIQFDFQVYTVCEGFMPQTINECDAWLITGSKFGVYEKLSWIPPLTSFIREIVDAKIPLVGICFGHQLIAQALGGRVEKSVKGWGLGLDTYSLTADSPLKTNACDSIKLQIFHQDQVIELPPGAKVFAQSDFCEYAGFYIGDKLMTIQAHPEFLSPYNLDLLSVRKQSVLPVALAEAAQNELELHNAQPESNLFGRWMAEFIQA